MTMPIIPPPVYGGPFVLVPNTITDAMLSSSTIPEPAASETVWSPSTNYAVGQQAILASTHRVYTNSIAGINATSPELALTGPTPRWLDSFPTQKWAAFDGQINTQSIAVTSLTNVVLPGLFNSIAFYGLEGGTLSVSIKDAPGGTVVYTYSASLQRGPFDYYDYYFGAIQQLTKVLLRNITPYANPEVTITVAAGAGVKVKVGMIVFANLRSLVSISGTGGTLYGAKVKPVTYSYIGTDLYNNLKIVRRTSGTDMEIQASVPIADADSALAAMQSVLDVPAAWIGSDQPNYTGLNVFGLASGDVSYGGPSHAIITVNVKGIS